VPAGKLQNTPFVRGDVSETNVPIHDQALAEKIRQLQEDRGRHARAIAEIDEVLARIQDALGALNGSEYAKTKNVKQIRRQKSKKILK